MNDSNLLEQHLTEHKIYFEKDEDSILVAGYRVSFLDDEYIVLSISHNNRIFSEPLYLPDKVLDYILILSGSLESRIRYIMKDRIIYYKRKRRFLDNIEGDRDIIEKILDKGFNDHTLLRESIDEIEYLLGFNNNNLINPSISESIIIKKFQTEIVLPIPLDPNYILDNKITVIDFVLKETFNSCPGILSDCIRIAKGEKIMIFPYQLEKKMSFKKSIGGSYDIFLFNSPFKINIYNTILALLSKDNNFSMIKSNNLYVWQQLSWIYSFSLREVNLLPYDFVQKLKGFSLTK